MYKFVQTISEASCPSLGLLVKKGTAHWLSLVGLLSAIAATHRLRRSNVCVAAQDCLLYTWPWFAVMGLDSIRSLLPTHHDLVALSSRQWLKHFRLQPIQGLVCHFRYPAEGKSWQNGQHQKFVCQNLSFFPEVEFDFELKKNRHFKCSQTQH